MGYDVHITRSTNWSENQGQEISSQEWMALVAADSELTLDPSNGPFAVRWSTTWFDWFEGNVFTCDPEQVTVGKMIELAGRLEAVVQGDNGEFYESARQWRGGDAGASQSP